MTRQRPWRADHPDAVIVARPSKWGNPYRIAGHLVGNRRVTRTRQECVDAYRALWQYGVQGDGLDLAQLTGRDLACWCPLDQPCHADVLLEIANPGSGDSEFTTPPGSSAPCSGDDRCLASPHLHGCHADDHADCDDPTAHDDTGSGSHELREGVWGEQARGKRPASAGTARVTRSVDCPEGHAHAHPLTDPADSGDSEVRDEIVSLLGDLGMRIRRDEDPRRSR